MSSTRKNAATGAPRAGTDGVASNVAAAPVAAGITAKLLSDTDACTDAVRYMEITL